MPQICVGISGRRKLDKLGRCECDHLPKVLICSRCNDWVEYERGRSRNASHRCEYDETDWADDGWDISLADGVMEAPNRRLIIRWKGVTMFPLLFRGLFSKNSASSGRGPGSSAGWAAWVRLVHLENVHPIFGRLKVAKTRETQHWTPKGTKNSTRNWTAKITKNWVNWGSSFGVKKRVSCFDLLAYLVVKALPDNLNQPETHRKTGKKKADWSTDSSTGRA